MARIISQVNPETGRRQKVASVEGKTFEDRTNNLASAFDTTPRKALRLSNTQIANKVTPSSIPLTTLSSTETPAIAPQVPASAPALIDSMLTSLPETLKTQRQQTQKAEESSFESLMAEALGQETPSAIRARVEKEQGIQELDLQATELSNQLLAEQEALRKKVEQVETAAGTATAGERDRQIAEITRVSRRQQADLAITQLAAQGRLDSARKFADTLVQAEIEEGTKRINVLQMAYERNKELFTKAEQREFELAQADRERELEKDTYEWKARLDQKIKESDPAYQLELGLKSLALKEAQMKYDALVNPDPAQANPLTLERIGKLTDKGREVIVNTNDTIGQLERIKKLVADNDTVTLSNPLTAEGRLFQRLATDVADKLARERTGAVVTQEEQDNFKRILGLSFGTRLTADPNEINNEIDYFIRKHESAATLYDPVGDIRGYLSSQIPNEDEYLDQVETQLGGGDFITNYVQSLNIAR